MQYTATYKWFTGKNFDIWLQENLGRGVAQPSKLWGA